MRMALQDCAASLVAAACLSVMVTAPAAAQQTQRFEEKTAERLAELRIDSNQVSSTRYVIKRKIDDRAGPEISGVEAYVSLTGCSGYLVVQMTRAAYIRQTYTTGDCEVAGVPNY